MKRLILIFALLAVVFPAEAQADYIWEAGNLSLAYPIGWNEPLPDPDTTTLYLAQTLVDAPDMRPPGIPIITLKILPSTSADLEALLTEELRTLGIDLLEAPISATLLEAEGVALTGVNADGSLFGIGQAAPISDTEVLLVVGRALDVQRDVFTPTFDALITSLTTDRTAAVQTPTYGVVWHTMRTQADGEDGFLNFVGLAYTANQLYTYERDLGLVEVDAATGTILSLTPNADITEPVDLAVDTAGTVYVADTACTCLFVRDTEGAWRETPITGFGDGAPQSIATASDGRLYATNVTTDNTLSVSVYLDGSFERSISLDAGLFQQPFLTTTPDGRVLILTQYGEIFEVTGSAFLSLGSLPEAITDFAVDAANNVILTTADFGLIAYNADGEEIERLGRIVPNFPLAGEFVSPVAVTAGTDGALYIADSDGTFGAITAMSTQVTPDRVGSTDLTLGLAVQGLLDENTTQQTWTYTGAPEQRLTISALDTSDQLNLALRLIAPDGSEIAYNDDQTSDDLPGITDAQILDHPLSVAGTYIVVVERVDGSGAYRLGISTTQSFTLGTDGVTMLDGEITDVFPVQRWQFEGQAGQTFTITMQTSSDSLDPALRLIAPDGSEIDSNDDADDPILGTNAQIFGAQLPASGLYTIEARRFEGEGRYELVIVAIA